MRTHEEAMSILWNCEERVTDLLENRSLRGGSTSDLLFSVPSWIDRSITPSEIASIAKSGVMAGYMPVAADWSAAQTMSLHGDDVLAYLEDFDGDIVLPEEVQSWSRLAVFYLALAVERWASSVVASLADTIENQAPTTS